MITATDHPTVLALEIGRDHIVKHESRHAAGLVLAGALPGRIEVGPQRGVVEPDWSQTNADYALTEDSIRALLKATLAGGLGSGEPAPGWPIEPVDDDARALRALVQRAGIDRAGYRQLVAETRQLMGTAEFKELADLFAEALETRSTLDTAAVRDVLGPGRLWRYFDSKGRTTMKRKPSFYETLVKTLATPPLAKDLATPPLAKDHDEASTKAKPPITVKRLKC